MRRRGESFTVVWVERQKKNQMGIKVSGDFGWKNTRKVSPEGAVIRLQQVGHFPSLPAFHSPGI